MRRLGIAAVLVLATVLFFLTIAQRDEKGVGALAAVGKRPADALMRADAAFDSATAATGIDGWVSFFAEDGAMMPSGGPVIRGPGEIRKLMGPEFATPGFSIRWKPGGAEVSASEDLGYTFGTSTVIAPGPDGKPVTRYGKYLTVWRKQADGAWKVAMDIGNAAPAPEKKD